MNNPNIKSAADQELLAQFFAEARTPVADDGFSTRVMQQIAAQRAARSSQPLSSLSLLSRWNFWLNTITAVSGLLFLWHEGFFGLVWEHIQRLFRLIVVGIATFDPDTLLVNALLLLHRLPDMLPSSTQFFSIALSILILLAFGAQRLVQMEGKIYHEIRG